MQEVTVKMNVPAGYKATGEYRVPQQGEPFLFKSGVNIGDGHVGEYHILRKSWTPEPWMPEGAWLFKLGGYWFISCSSPDGVDSRHLAYELARLHGGTFTPPPVDKIQIKKG